MSKLKIAFIISSFPALSETFILNQITGLLDMNHEVKIFARSNTNENEIHPDIKKYGLMEKVIYINMPRNKIFRVLKALCLFIYYFYKSPTKILKSINIFKYGKTALSLKLLYFIIPFIGKKFDIIHCHFGPNGIIGACLKEIEIPGKYITSFHGYDVNCFPSIKGKSVYNNLFLVDDLFTTNTEFTKQQVVNLGCNEEKIKILPMGIKIEKFKFSLKIPRYGEKIKILTIGRLVEKKGHKYFIRAFERLLKKYKKIEYIIAGDGPLKNELKKLVINLGINNYVKFTGWCSEEEIINLYRTSHIFVLPSITSSNHDREGQALVLQEAQAMGLPVISTYHNGIPEGILNNKSGFLVPEKDVNALINRTRYLLENPEIWKKMGSSGRKFVEKKYDTKILSKQLEEIYMKVVCTKL